VLVKNTPAYLALVSRKKCFINVHLVLILVLERVVKINVCREIGFFYHNHKKYAIQGLGKLSKNYITQGKRTAPNSKQSWGNYLSLHKHFHIFSSIVHTFLHWKWGWNIPCAYKWKVAEKGFKINFMMNKLVMIISFEIILEKKFAKNYCEIQSHTTLVCALYSIRFGSWFMFCR
jgi:hypothetical protein